MDITRRTRTAIVGVVALAVVSLSTAPADARTGRPVQSAACPPQQTVAALDQYCDSLPGSNGQSQPGGTGQARPAAPLSSELPPNVVRRLRGAGAAARALLTIPAGQPPIGSRSQERRAASGASNLVENAGGGDAPTAVTKLVTAVPDVLGGAFRWGLVVSTLGIVGIGWLRFRARFGP